MSSWLTANAADKRAGCRAIENEDYEQDKEEDEEEDGEDGEED
jgi:hypothetical protein